MNDTKNDKPPPAVHKVAEQRLRLLTSRPGIDQDDVDAAVETVLGEVLAAIENVLGPEGCIIAANVVHSRASELVEVKS